MTDVETYPFPQNKPDHPSFGLLTAWWRRLEDDKGERALLRRAGTLTEVMLSPSFVDLLRTLRNQGYIISNHNHPLSRIAAIAGLSARIKALADEGLATRMGTPKAVGSSPTLSELRLRRILACDDIEDLYMLLRRALAVLDDKADLTDLAATVWNWSPLDEKRPYDPRRRLAYDYYAAAPLKP